MIVVRIQLHTPRLAPAALGSVFEYGKKVSGNSRNNKIFEYGKKMSGNSRTNKIFEYGKKVSGNRETTKSLEYGKCLETGKGQNPLKRKVSRNRKMAKSFEYGCVTKKVSDAGYRTTF